MNAFAISGAWYIPDLRRCHDECVKLSDGSMLYRKEKTVQLWPNTLVYPEINRETLIFTTVRDAEKCFSAKWISEEYGDDFNPQIYFEDKRKP